MLRRRGRSGCWAPMRTCCVLCATAVAHHNDPQPSPWQQVPLVLTDRAVATLPPPPPACLLTRLHSVTSAPVAANVMSFLQASTRIVCLSCTCSEGSAGAGQAPEASKADIVEQRTGCQLVPLHLPACRCVAVQAAGLVLHACAPLRAPGPRQGLRQRAAPMYRPPSHRHCRTRGACTPPGVPALRHGLRCALKPHPTAAGLTWSQCQKPAACYRAPLHHRAPYLWPDQHQRQL